MKKTLLLTMAIGDTALSLAALTHSTLKSYAEKVNADFLVIEKQDISKTTPHWEKFQIYSLLNRYERILYLDTDLIVREDCPNLFDIVPSDKIGLFNEAPFTDRSSQQKLFGLKAYYNSGVMVISRKHKELFKKPELEQNDFFEQTYLNTQFKDADVFELDYKFDRMCCMDSFLGISRLDSYIIHYAGCPTVALTKELIAKDLAAWSDKKYEYKQRFYISVSGGLGDQVCSQPAISYLRKLLPEAELNVATHYPRIFRDEEGLNVFLQGKFLAEPDTPYITLDAFPGPDSSVFSVISANLCNRVDYSSVALLKRILPVESKRVKLSVTLKDIAKVVEVVGIRRLDELTLIHAGKHWDTKTLPKEYWEKIIDGLVKKNIPVCLIGKTGSPGVWEFAERKDVINTVDLLDLDAIIALISKAKCLISNDSSPVHIAGAFDNEIIVIPTVNHPEHILPFRPKQSYALCKRLLLEDYKTTPFLSDPKGVYAGYIDKTHYDWDRYLLDSDRVIELVEKFYA